jgi:hypothetical protein
MPKHYAPFHPDHEFLGRVVLNMRSALGSQLVTFEKVFEKYGLGDVDPAAWYPAQKWFDVINEIAEMGFPMMDFVGIGMKTVENAVIPPEARALPITEFLTGATKTYSLHNRGTDIGEQRCEVVSDTHVKMILRMPHPDDFWYGAFYGLMRNLLPVGTRVTVYYDKTQPRRDEGGEETVIHIDWEPPKSAQTSVGASEKKPEDSASSQPVTEEKKR